MPIIIVKGKQLLVQLQNGQTIAQMNLQVEQQKLATMIAEIDAARTLNREQGGGAVTSNKITVNQPAGAKSGVNMSKVTSWVSAITAGIAALALFITMFRSAFNGTQEAADKAMEKINQIQAEIYTNVDKKNTFTNLISQFETLDEKIVKTSEDLEEMSNIRAQLLENFTEDERMSMQNMSTDQIVRAAELKSLELEADNKVKLKEVEGLFKKASNMKLVDVGAAIVGAGAAGLTAGALIGGAAGGTVTAGMAAVPGAVFGGIIGGAAGLAVGAATSIIKNANYRNTQKKVEKMLATDEGLAQAKYLYAGSMDTTDVADKEERARINAMYQSVISTLDAAEMQDLIMKTGKSAEQLAEEFENAMVANGGSLEILSDSSSSTRDRIAALNVVMNAVPTEELSDQFKELYADLIALNENFPGFIDYMDRLGLNVGQVNEFGKIAEAEGLDANAILTQMGGILLPDGKTIGEVATVTAQLEAAFGTLSPAMRQAIADMIDGERSLQAIAEDQTAAVSEAKNLRETQAKWGEMTAAQRADFMTSNAGLFQDENGQFSQEKFDRFVGGGDISGMISDYQNTERSRIAQDYNAQLIADNVRLGGLKDELALATTDAEREAIQAKIEALKGEIAATEYMIENLPSMYELSLAEIVKVQQTQIAYQKEMLQAEQDALVKSLEKRKEAYQDYFDAINEAYETQTYEEDKARILEQMGKLGAGTDATSLAKGAELQKQLIELEKKRGEDRRQAAQEAVMTSIDDQIETSNEKYDKMLENDNLMLKLIGEGNRYQYEAMLIAANKTPEEIASLMQGFDAATYDLYNPTVNTPVAGNIEATPVNNNQFNFAYNNQQISFTNAEINAISNLLRQALARAGIPLQYNG